MLREFGAFLLLFALLGLIVGQSEIVYLFVAAAFIAFAIDLVFTRTSRISDPSRVRRTQSLEQH